MLHEQATSGVQCGVSGVIAFEESPIFRDPITTTRLFGSGFFQVAAECVAHCRKKLVLVFRFTAGRKTLIQRSGKNRDRDALINRCLDRPTALARVGDMSFKLLERGVLSQGGGCQVQ
jgi:hypothetical protein